MKTINLLITILYVSLVSAAAQTAWEADLDSPVRFYQTTDFGIVLAGTERSLYALDGQTGERVWRRDTGRINETAVTPVPDTDLILLTRDLGSKSRFEAVDLISGASIWKSDKVKGDVMQLAADPESDLISVILVRGAKGDVGDRVKGKPIVHVLRLSDGEELWKREMDTDVEMMPSRFGEGLGEIAYTLDNYRAPLVVDGRLFLFYEGATSFDARTGKEKEREKFRINEEGLALTEADPIFDDTRVYLSGRGRIRAVNRRTGSVEWRADDIGIAAEMVLVGSTLYVRTGGQFTRLKDGEPVSKGPFGVAALDTQSGAVLWRYKGADKGLTNFVFADANTILVADRDDLIRLDATTGKRVDRLEHKIEKAQFVLINERGDAVVGGRDEIAAFRAGQPASAGGGQVTFSLAAYKSGALPPARAGGSAREVWRVRHKAPGRGAFRIIAGVALRATALYFRYGGLATSAFGIARGGLNLASAANSLRWSGIRSRFGSFDLTTLASNSARNYVTRRFYAFGSFARSANIANRVSGLQMITPSGIRGGIVNRVTPSGSDVRESVLDRLDPTRYAEQLSDYLLRRKRLAEIRGNHMYFYTDLGAPFDRKGLVGVNVHTGRDARYILASDPDEQFVTDEVLSLLYSANGDKLRAFDVMSR